MKSIITPYARIGLFYITQLKSLLSEILVKDMHIKALQEKLSESGGSYFPRKHKYALDSFDETAWREKSRKEVSKQKESGWEVFEQWSKVGEVEIEDWDAVVAGLGQWSQDASYKVFLLWIILI
jgi:hypothetical protein